MPDQNKDKIAEGPSTQKSIQSLANKFRARALYLRRQSSAFLLIIVVTIIGGAYILYFAQQITGDVIEKRVNELDPAIRSIDSNIAAITTDVKLLLGAKTRVRDISELISKSMSNTENILAEGRPLATQLKRINEKLAHLASVRLESISDDEADKVIATFQNLNKSLSETRVLSFEMNRCFNTYYNTYLNGLSPDQNCTEVALPQYSDFVEVMNGYYVRQQNLIDVTRDMSIRGLRHIEIATDNVDLDGGELSAVQELFAKSMSEVNYLQDKIPELIDAMPSKDDLALEGEIDARNIIEQRRVISQVASELKFLSSQLAKEDESLLSFARSTSLRVASIILIIFLVQILVNLFRYGTRLAAFYEARADSLEIITSSGRNFSPSEIQQIVSSLSPDTVDFGRGTRSPVDQSLEISRNLAALARGMR